LVECDYVLQKLLLYRTETDKGLYVKCDKDHNG